MTQKLFLSLVLSCVSSVALAAGMGYSSDKSGSSQYQSSDETFQSLDTNNDGKLSKSEAAAAPNVKDHWSKADTNNDGSLDKAEFSAFESSHMQKGNMGTGSGTDYNRPANPGSGMQ